MLISLIGAAALVALLERIPRLQLSRQPFFRSFLVTDAFYLLTGFVVGGAISVAYITRGLQFFGNVLALPRLAALALPIWIVVILALLALDAGNYAAHYCLHRFGILWELHKVHHSSPKLDWLATFRFHIAEQILRRLLAPLLLMLLGFPLKAVVIAGAFLLAWGILNHANLRLNLEVLESVLITPRLHRIHHLNNSPMNNLGTIFTFWDKLRGTLDRTKYAEDRELGNGERDYPQSWLRQFSEPIRRISRSGSRAIEKSKSLLAE